VSSDLEHPARTSVVGGYTWQGAAATSENFSVLSSDWRLINGPPSC